MTGRETIIHFLGEHDCFTVNEIIQTYGCSKKLVCSAASAMVRRGELSRVKEFDGNTIYYPVCGLSFLESSIDIFDMCRNSPAMKRVLVVWGILTPDVLKMTGRNIS
ncbi:hypothetical protein S451_17030 [Salmonella enterica subsp. enterica]|nr:hypothetical protein [Salmonella enterica subsp. enterica]ECJ7251607.1 hypothetical protein [Salmonella enterica subsp. enterica]